MGVFNRRVRMLRNEIVSYYPILWIVEKKKNSRTKEIEDLHLNDIHARRGRIGEQKDAIADPW